MSLFPIEKVLSIADLPPPVILSHYSEQRVNASSLTWEDPWFDDPATMGFEPRRMTLEPDNDFQQISLSGSYRMGFLDSTLSFGFSNGQGEQDEPLLPYTSNANLTAGPLPRRSPAPAIPRAGRGSGSPEGARFCEASHR